MWKSLMEKNMEYKSMSEAVRVLFERYPLEHEFGLWDLKHDVVRLYPPAGVMHGDTISRRLREFRYGNGWEIICINPNKSRYKKIPLVIKGKCTANKLPGGKRKKRRNRAALCGRE